MKYKMISINIKVRQNYICFIVLSSYLPLNLLGENIERNQQHKSKWDHLA